jgi:hypothetical protein
MEVSIHLNKLNLITAGYIHWKFHLVFPEATHPYNYTSCLSLNKPILFKYTEGHPLFAVLHIYDDQSKKLKHRSILQPKVNQPSTFTCHEFQIAYEVQIKNSKDIPVASPVEVDLRNIILNLTDYTRKGYNLLQQYSPVDEVIRRKHSIQYDLEVLPYGNLQIPYVTLCLKGNTLLSNISHQEISQLQLFFRKHLHDYLGKEGRLPTDVVRQSKRAYEQNDRIVKHAFMIQVANYFSKLTHDYIYYKGDYEMTSQSDYVGLNILDGVLQADCEDIATCAYNVMRVFRRIFPSDLKDVLTPSTTLPYHISSWLNHSKIFLMQGSALPSKDEAQINHIWTGILLNDTCPLVIVEGTRESTDYSKYKYLLRAWTHDNDKVYDLFFVNKETKQYGLPMDALLNSFDAPQVFSNSCIDVCEKSNEPYLKMIGNIKTDPVTMLEQILRIK